MLRDHVDVAKASPQAATGVDCAQSGHLEEHRDDLCRGLGYLGGSQRNETSRMMGDLALGGGGARHLLGNIERKRARGAELRLHTSHGGLRTTGAWHGVCLLLDRGGEGD